MHEGFARGSEIPAMVEGIVIVGRDDQFDASRFGSLHKSANVFDRVVFCDALSKCAPSGTLWD